MTTLNTKVIHDIVEIIKYYRYGEIDLIDYRHVEKWILQFPSTLQNKILEETLFSLKKRYVSKEDIMNIFYEALDSKEIFGISIIDTLQNSHFIDEQLYGSSQTELLKLFSQVVTKKFNFKLENKLIHEAKHIFYIDECIFSGNRIIQDLTDFVNYYGIRDIEITVLVIGAHSNGYDYIDKCLKYKLRQRGIKFRVYSEFFFNNYETSFSGVFFPKNNSLDENVINYCTKLINEKQLKNNLHDIFRCFEDKENDLFSSRENRDIIENQFLEIGVSLIGDYNKDEFVKPLGFSKFLNLGFGGYFITYRNIPNNCPIALWFDRGEIYTHSNTSKEWYPLFPRKVSKKNILNRPLLKKVLSNDEL